VWRTESLVTYADLSTLSAFGGNDFVVDGRGNAFVNIPGYDAMTGPPSGNTAAERMSEPFTGRAP